jgi:hypothetical protein
MFNINPTLPVGQQYRAYSVHGFNATIPGAEDPSILGSVDSNDQLR